MTVLVMAHVWAAIACVPVDGKGLTVAFEPVTWIALAMASVSMARVYVSEDFMAWDVNKLFVPTTVPTMVIASMAHVIVIRDTVEKIVLLSIAPTIAH